MKKILILLIGIAISISSYAKGGGNVSVRGYVKKDGTYVQPHHRTAPDGTKLNNWSHAGNVNPYTGKVGTNTDTSPNYQGHYGSSNYTRTNQGAYANSIAPLPQNIDSHYTITNQSTVHNTRTADSYLD